MGIYVVVRIKMHQKATKPGKTDAVNRIFWEIQVKNEACFNLPATTWVQSWANYLTSPNHVFLLLFISTWIFPDLYFIWILSSKFKGEKHINIQKPKPN